MHCIFRPAINSKSLTSAQNIMKNHINALKMRLKNLDEKIEAVENQLPAHSAKPFIMSQLFELEDERDAVLKELEQIKHRGLGNI